MAITKIIENSGNLTTTSSDGKINIDQSAGTITIRDGVTRVVEIDKDGFKYYDTNGVERIGFGQSSDGKQQIIVYDANGIPTILIGQDPKDGSPVIAVSEKGGNVITELQRG